LDLTYKISVAIKIETVVSTNILVRNKDLFKATAYSSNCFFPITLTFVLMDASSNIDGVRDSMDLLASK
jgi:hypothetical protein